MSKKALIVLTSQDTIGNTTKKTGAYLIEFTNMFFKFLEKGYQIDFASPKGGKTPLDGVNLENPINKNFMENPEYLSRVENTIPLNKVDPKKYSVIYLAGGHGAMWDFPENKDLAKVVAQIYETNGVVGAICHGVSGLLNVKLSNGKALVENRNINSFTNEEEEAVKLDKLVPFLLETELELKGAKFLKSPKFTEHVEISDRLLTGQNPQSAEKLAQEIIKILN